MGDHLKVDADVLRRTAAKLGEISAVLRASSAHVGQDRSVLGHPGLEQVMNDFVDNWRVHRERLVSAVEAQRQMAASSADAYTETDQEFADSLRSPGPGHRSGGPR